MSTAAEEKGAMPAAIKFPALSWLAGAPIFVAGARNKLKVLKVLYRWVDPEAHATTPKFAKSHSPAKKLKFLKKVLAINYNIVIIFLCLEI
jgi:hypothetical protein